MWSFRDSYGAAPPKIHVGLSASNSHYNASRRSCPGASEAKCRVGPCYNGRMHSPALSRRALLSTLGGGFGALALKAMLAEDARTDDNFAVAQLHHPPKARRVLQLFMNGGASQMDTFDYKPELEKQHGKKVDFG